MHVLTRVCWCVLLLVCVCARAGWFTDAENTTLPEPQTKITGNRKELIVYSFTDNGKIEKVWPAILLSLSLA